MLHKTHDHLLISYVGSCDASKWYSDTKSMIQHAQTASLLPRQGGLRVLGENFAVCQDACANMNETLLYKRS